MTLKKSCQKFRNIRRMTTQLTLRGKPIVKFPFKIKNNNKINPNYSNSNNNSNNNSNSNNNCSNSN